MSQLPIWLEYKGYVAEVDYDPEDKVYFGDVLNANKDLILFESLTLDEMQAHFQEAIDDYEELVQQTQIINKRRIPSSSIREG